MLASANNVVCSLYCNLMVIATNIVAAATFPKLKVLHLHFKFADLLPENKRDHICGSDHSAAVLYKRFQREKWSMSFLF